MQGTPTSRKSGSNAPDRPSLTEPRLEGVEKTLGLAGTGKSRLHPAWPGPSCQTTIPNEWLVTSSLTRVTLGRRAACDLHSLECPPNENRGQPGSPSPMSPGLVDALKAPVCLAGASLCRRPAFDAETTELRPDPAPCAANYPRRQWIFLRLG
jgi:hypothetical protein